MSDAVLQQQLDEVRALLARAHMLFGSPAAAPPVDITPAPPYGE